MSKRLNVLSIDFDFFQKVDKDTLMDCYPDGHDFPSELSKIIWSPYYANPKTAAKLQTVHCDKKMLKNLRNLLDKCRKDIPVKIANSHLQIYSFIHEQSIEQKKIKIDLTNIDMHHDMVNSNDTIDCGNWIKYIAENFNTKITWIANPISTDMYGMDKEKFNMIAYDFDSLVPEDIDMIFLCRSDIWFPPHLDKYFDDFKKYLASNFDNVQCEKDVMEPRDIADLVQKQKEIMSSIMKQQYNTK